MHQVIDHVTAAEQNRDSNENRNKERHDRLLSVVHAAIQTFWKIMRSTAKTAPTGAASDISCRLVHLAPANWRPTNKFHWEETRVPCYLADPRSARSSTASISAPPRTTIADSHIHVIKPTIAPSEP